jgi:hypothetical protein
MVCNDRTLSRTTKYRRFRTISLHRTGPCRNAIASQAEGTCSKDLARSLVIFVIPIYIANPSVPTNNYLHKWVTRPPSKPFPGACEMMASRRNDIHIGAVTDLV